MDELLRLLGERRWQSCLRVNIAEPKDIVVSPSGFKRVKLNSNVVLPAERDLAAAVRRLAPVGTEGHRIVVNRNVTCQPHRDPANDGPSYCLFLGDFTGGELIFADGKMFTEKHTWHEINGQVEHWNEPHEGTKYSVILFKPSKPSKCGH